jgi:hypothetical protein
VGNAYAEAIKVYEEATCWPTLGDVLEKVYAEATCLNDVLETACAKGATCSCEESVNKNPFAPV